MFQTTTKEHEDLKAEINYQIAMIYLELDDSAQFVNAPGASVSHLPFKSQFRVEVENSALKEFIECAYQVKLPDKVVMPGHKSQFDFVADLYFERVENAVGFANRTGGKTLGVAILNHLDMMFKPGCEIASAGATLDQAQKCYRYFQNFNNKEWFKDLSTYFESLTGEKFLIKETLGYTKFGTGSILEIVTGSEKGLRSPHPHKARLDEIDLMEWQTIQTGLSMSRSDDKIVGQNVFTSTRQQEQGPMQMMLDQAAEKGFEVYEWNIWEAVQKCPRRCLNDQNFGDCPIYTYCKGRAHHSDGFYQIRDFISKVRGIDRRTFQVEWENSKPARHKLVYHSFDNTRHIMTPKKLHALTQLSGPSRYWHRIGGLDFGSAPGHPFVFLNFCQLPNSAWLLFHEYVAEQRLLRDHARSIIDSPFYNRGDIIYADWDAQDRLELAFHGVRTRPAKKAKGDVLTGIDWVSTLLSGFPPSEEPMLYVWHECSYTISEFSKYSWPVKPNGEPDKSGNPEKKNDHAMDATRYALYSSKTSGQGGTRSFNLNF